jgi:hypothetical protein
MRVRPPRIIEEGALIMIFASRKCSWVRLLTATIFKNIYTVMTCMTVITVRIDDETKDEMDKVDVNWSEVIRGAIRRRIDEEKRRNLARAVLINEEVRRPSRGGEEAEEIIRRFRDERP